MDELKFREGLNTVIPTLKLFVAGFNDGGQSFINYINALDKEQIQKFYDEYSTKNFEKINRVRIKILEKLLKGSITLDEINTIFDDEKTQWDKNQLKIRTVPRILFPFCYGENKYIEKYLGKFLIDLGNYIIKDAGYDKTKVSKPGQVNFDGSTHFGKDGFYLGFGNKTHPDYTTMNQFRIESEGDDKINIGIYHYKKGFIEGQYKKFDINKITLKDVINEAIECKNIVESDIFVGENAPNILDYIKDNIDKFSDIKEKAEEERKLFNEKFPLEKLKELPIEEYNYGMGKANTGSFTWYLNTDYTIAGWLFSNGQNWLFFKGEDGTIQSAKVMNDYLERGNGDIKAAFEIYKSDLYDFIKNFDIETYNPKDFLAGANYIKASLIFLYKGDILVSLGLPSSCRAIATILDILPDGAEKTKNTDILQYDIIISKYLKENIPDIIDKYGFSAIGKCLDKYYELYLMKQLKQNNKQELNDSILTDQPTPKMTNPKISLNTILYGVPGTGKTYNTVNYAVAAIESKDLKDVCAEDWIIVKKRYDQYKSDGQIVFTTFHQSFGYEDFVEGIKAKVEESGNINYDVESGIFKNLCEVADSEGNISKVSKSDVDVDKVQIFKMSLGEVGVDDSIYDYCIDNNVVALGFSDMNFSELKKSATTKEIKEFMSKNNPNEEIGFTADAIFRFKSWMNSGDLVFISKGNLYLRAIGKVTSEYFYDENTPIEYKHFRKVEWLLKDVNIPVERINNKKFSQQSIYNLQENAYKQTSLKLDEIKKLIGKSSSTEKRNYVLIIDEINRGNISKIFGELITLIEPNKRLGGQEQIKVKLPYSQKEFGVPNNLYILGTMNTADRSIALIDLALRRRFVFKEIEPNSKLLEGINIDGIDVASIFDVINRRIEFLYDRDHLLGHAYFLPLKSEPTLEKLNNIMLDKIIPLLQEYFHDDWEKIQLVLGKGLIHSEEVVASDVLGTDNTDYEDQTKYSINLNPSVEDYNI